jgi:hypothetical protein
MLCLITGLSYLVPVAAFKTSSEQEQLFDSADWAVVFASQWDEYTPI